MLQYHHYIELIAFTIGVACFNRSWLLHYKILFFLLGLTCLVEIVGVITSTKSGDNSWLYNLYSPIQCLAILYFFSSIILKRKLRDTVGLTIPLMFAATVVTYIIQPDFMKYNNYAHTIYLILWIIVCSLYFIDVMINDSRVDLIKQPGFWFATGVLFFSVIFIIVISVYKTLTIFPDFKKIVQYFNIVANTFMYVGFAGAFICQTLATKYYSRSLQQA